MCLSLEAVKSFQLLEKYLPKIIFHTLLLTSECLRLPAITTQRACVSSDAVGTVIHTLAFGKQSRNKGKGKELPHSNS